MNIIFIAIILSAVVFAVFTGTPAEVGQAAFDGAKASVDLAIGLVGYMALFLGLVKVVEKAGGLQFLARLLRPVMVRLFPEIPPDHPAIGAMVMNMAANALGLVNAATPFGLKAMKELDSLNTEKGTATNAMCLFLAINTSGLALLPTGMIGLRALKGSTDPAVIFPTTLFATGISTIVGITAALLLARLPVFARTRPPVDKELERKRAALLAESRLLVDLVPLALFLSVFGAMVALVFAYREAASAWIMPVLIALMVLVGVVRRVHVYEAFIEGAKEGFSLGVMIIPYLVAILSAVGMLRASGGISAIVGVIGPITGAFGLPGEVLPLALIRPLTGTGAFGLAAELMQTHGPDSYIGQLASTMTGSTETTLYVLAVYFGSVGVSKTRHALAAGLSADVAGVIGSVLAVKLLLG